MMHALAHRGPDGQGILAAPGAVFGMRRLSIIDISGGQQPIWNESKTLAVVFNGEIYNFRQLRRSLENQGHLFSTESDTETIIHAYETWGANCVRHLRGMFAFAVMELPNGRHGQVERVFLARDRMGVKPLYYARANGSFLFASEVRALLASNSIPRKLSPSAVSSYLLFGSVSEPVTLVESIQSLPPGHCGYVSPASPSQFEPRAYWGVREAVESSPARSGAEAAEQVRAALEDAVRCHLIADVPVGIFLSSGMDSTALAVLATQQCARVKTFTAIFDEEQFSEARLARSIADRLGTDHAEFLLTGEEMRLRLSEAVAAFDQPSVDGINTFFISWAARQAGLKVALSGLGGDETFGGYSTFHTSVQVSRLMAVANYLPRSTRRAVAHLWSSIASWTPQPDRVRKAASAFLRPNDFPHAYFFTRALFSPRAVATLRHQPASELKGSLWWQWLSNAAADTDRLDRFTAVSWLELRSYLANMLLRDTDAMSMCHSLEVRVPFLDASLLKTALSSPANYKQQKGAPKALLAKALGDLLPEAVVSQRKRTFTLPWEVWLRASLRERVHSSLSNCDPCLSCIIDIGEVLKVWKAFLAGQTSWSRPWSLFILNEWVKRNLTGASKVFASESQAAAPAVF